MTSIINWRPTAEGNQTTIEQCTNIVRSGGVAVTPTKVGYIIIASTRKGLEKKFELKGRPQTKPSVVLCPHSSMVSLLARTNKKIDRLYDMCNEKGLLLGCILPWKKTAFNKYVPKDNSGPLVMDNTGTSCFVINFGTPSEEIAKNLWGMEGLLAFASSANPSGTGNKGRLAGVGEKIIDGADFIVKDDYYVRQQQPDKDVSSRYEQGVMVSMVNKMGKLSDAPVVIRKGLDLDRIMIAVSEVYDSFDYRHGQYH